LASAIDRIGLETGNTANKVWTVTGTNSKIVVGTPAIAAAMRVSSTKNVVGTIDVGNNSFFYHNQPTGPTFTLGTLATTSTVEFNSGGIPFIIPANQYGNLKATGGTNPTLCRKELSGNIVVAGTIGLGNASTIVLGNYDLTVLSTGITTSSSSAFIVTNGSGRLRIRVPRAASATTPGAKITFPVGNDYTSYTPVTLQQTSTSSDDVFEVRVVSVGSEVVNKTWLISKEVPANAATVKMTLQWNASEATTNFVPANAHINHYTGGAWDVYKTEMGATGSGPYVATRAGITSFSPFSVSSRVDGALPVELLSFTAKRTGATVSAAWATASEKNSAYFAVERSVSGAEFEAIGTVKAAGASTQRLDYAFEDKAPLPGTAYYRLRQTDTDGTLSFSPVVAVKGTAAALAVAVPNPSTGRFEIRTPAAEVRATEVINVVGARVAAQAATATNGRLAVDLSAQPAGTYFIRLQTATGTQVVRVVKQ
jgi:Secretion system C-terminal sorting domain